MTAHGRNATFKFNLRHYPTTSGFTVLWLPNFHSIRQVQTDQQPREERAYSRNLRMPVVPGQPGVRAGGNGCAGRGDICPRVTAANRAVHALPAVRRGS